MSAVQIEHVTKTFGQFVAVNDLNLEVPEGSIYGFIGPNGSGKTTTLRMIMRILHPELVLDVKREGTTVIFSRTDMAVVENMSDFIFMIHKGCKGLDGTLETIQDLYGSDTLRVRLEGNGTTLAALPGVSRVNDFGRL